MKKCKKCGKILVGNHKTKCARCNRLAKSSCTICAAVATPILIAAGGVAVKIIQQIYKEKNDTNDDKD